MTNRLEILLEKRRKKEERLKEKEKIKKEKELLKKQLKKEKRKKRLKQKQNKKYYNKIKEERLREREKKGDKRAYHMVVIMKNHKRIKRIGASWWMTDAYQIYNDAITKNRNEVVYPIQISESNEKKQKQGERASKTLYEIMIIQRTPNNQIVTEFRNKDGKFIPNTIIDSNDYTIIAKDEWFVEETFNVYGFHPIKDRKDFKFILNNILIPNKDYYDVKRVFVYNNRVIIQSNDDIDIITCKTTNEAVRLHDTLQKKTADIKYIVYTGKVKSKQISAWVLNKIEEKTGWKRHSCSRIHTL